MWPCMHWWHARRSVMLVILSTTWWLQVMTRMCTISHNAWLGHWKLMDNSFAYQATRAAAHLACPTGRHASTRFDLPTQSQSSLPRTKDVGAHQKPLTPAVHTLILTLEVAVSHAISKHTLEVAVSHAISKRVP
jgi:hypothetical protein